MRRTLGGACKEVIPLNHARKFTRSFIFRTGLAAGVLGAALAAPGFALALPQDAATSCKAPDNTAHNQKHNTTADQQGNSQADLDITANIRKSLMGDKSLSSYAHNVKIITNNGMVTLRGPVRSQAEMQTVLAKATEVAGSADKVTNRITVKADKDSGNGTGN